VTTRRIKNLFQVLLLLLVLVAVGLLSAIATMSIAIHGAEVQVPALQGMTVADARSQTAGLGLNLDVDNRYYSGDVAAGHILTQSPSPATVVRREWLVRVSESLGPQKVEVPSVVGHSEREAAVALRRVGLEVGVTARLPYSDAAEGTVIAQDPPAHAQGIARPSVDLLVAAASDDAPDGFLMPELVGLPMPSAQAMLARVGIHTAAPTIVNVAVEPVRSADQPVRPPIKPGSVLAQMPIAGARVDQSTVVHLSVAQ
jgi:beta-lactam-binding protein with PASTA domain